MYTQCPNCSALFKVTGEQLRSANGFVRCGGCQKVFHALESLSEDLADFRVQEEPALFVDEVIEAIEEPGETEIQNSSDAPITSPFPEDAGTGNDERPALFIDEVVEAIDSEHETPEEPAVAGEDAGDDVQPAEDDSETAIAAAADTKSQSSTELPLAIREAPAAAGTSGRQTALWLVAILLLVLVFLGQAVYFMRDDLARRYTNLRPMIEQFCRIAGCRLGTTGDIKNIHIIDREVRSHPGRENALQVTATFASTSALSQPFPDISLTMSDKHGMKIAGRRFTPQEYLQDTALISKGMVPKTPYHLSLDLADPGQNAVGFSFSFHDTMKLP